MEEESSTQQMKQRLHHHNYLSEPERFAMNKDERYTFCLNKP